jgi:hypothetical protein
VNRQLEKQIRDAYIAISALVKESTQVSGLLSESASVAAEQERRHRAFGRRLAGQISYRGSAQLCGMYFAAKAVLRPVSKPFGWFEAMGIRRDMALGYAVREWLEQMKPDQLRQLDRIHADILAIDCSADIAGNAA